ncbi:hypothetical protein ABVK25_012299 [Lepraria finkii]|uniref:Uncharacterized protein n=1 Tax=Lepraria finkii TaxID=1340010 RepID=A0ABR4AIV1_9LECA
MDEDRSISIPRDYFETLVRRAELHRDDKEYVHVPKAEYDDLVHASQEYHALQTALLSLPALIFTLWTS